MFENLCNTKPLIKEIEEISSGIDGWTPVDQLYTLFLLVFLTSNLEGDIVEIGSWCGRSTVILGLAARSHGPSIVHAIDLFPEKEDWSQNKDGSYSFMVQVNDSHAIGGYKDQTVWQKPYVNDIEPVYRENKSVLTIFKKNIAQHGLQDLVIPHKGDSTVIDKVIQSPIRLAFIDADHSYESVCNDIRNVEKYLTKGGYICFDDAFSCYDGVNKAINDMIISNDNYDICQQFTRKFFVARLR